MAILGGVFIALGKFFICGLSSFIGYYILTNVDPYKTELYSAYAPLFLMVILTYMIGDLFMSVYGMACDSIL